MQVAHGWPPERIGGVELYVRALHHGLRQAGLVSSVFHAGDTLQRMADRLQVPGPVRTPRSFRETVVRPDVEAWFRDWVWEHRPDVVHFHHLTHLSLGLPRVAREQGAVPVMTLHDYWLPCVRGQLVDRQQQRCSGPSPERCSPCVAGQLALAPGTAAAGRLLSVLPTAMRTRLREFVGRSSPRLDRVIRERQRLVEAAVARIQRFACPSRDLAARMTMLGLGSGRIDLTELPLVHPVAAAAPPGEGPVRFLFLGSLIPTKGPHLLVEAFARLPAGAATLHLAGPRPPNDLAPDYAERLVTRVRGLPGATIEEAFPPGQVQARLDHADVLVLPSLWEENSPLVVREATAAGLRVVVSRRGGVAELAPAARTFEPDESTSLLAALAAELRMGRGRVEPSNWDEPAAHARRVRSWYHRCLGMSEARLLS